MSDVFKMSKSRGTARVVLLALANYSDERGKCWPSLGRLAKDSNVARRNVIKAINSLCEIGEVQRVGTKVSRNGVNVYQILLGGDDSVTRDDSVTSTSDDSVTPLVTIPSPKLPLNRQLNRHKEKKAKSKGERLAGDWKANGKFSEWAKSKGYDGIQIQGQEERFLRYWTGPDCKNPLKRDWYRAWQNWLDADIERNGPPDKRRTGGNRTGRGSIATAVGEAINSTGVENGVPEVRY